MSDIRKRLMDVINKRAERKEALSKEISERHINAEDFVIKMLNELDNELSSAVNKSFLVHANFRNLYAQSIEKRIQTLDTDASVNVQWHESDGKVIASAILVKWSPEYQDRNKCEPELFIDVTSMLLKT